MFYPKFSDWYNQLHQSKVIVDYDRQVAKNSAKKNRQLWNEAKAYNKKISKTGLRFSLEGEEKEEYENTLKVTDSGVMGYIVSKKAKIRLPIYHDTTDSVLQIAVGHLAGTSLPVGGKSTHCVLTGHTGLPSARLFTDIDKLKKGDTFQLIVLDHRLTYKVDKIQTVLPDLVEKKLKIESGRDLCTLVTCTPYGINTHRLLVTGHRIPTPKGGRPSADWKRRQLMLMLERILPVLAAAAIATGYAAYRQNVKNKKIKGKH